MAMNVPGPVRTCVGCRTAKLAATMLRVTRRIDGDDLVFGGSSNGRGAWICSDACRQKALTSGALERSLKRRGRVRR